MTKKEYAYWLADKIPAYGDYAKESAQVLVRQADEIECLQQRIKELEVRVRYFESITTGAEHDAIDRLCSPSPEDK